MTKPNLNSQFVGQSLTVEQVLKERGTTPYRLQKLKNNKDVLSVDESASVRAAFVALNKLSAVRRTWSQTQ
jgi:hypothetical protein